MSSRDVLRNLLKALIFISLTSLATSERGQWQVRQFSDPMHPEIGFPPTRLVAKLDPVTLISRETPTCPAAEGICPGIHAYIWIADQESILQCCPLGGQCCYNGGTTTCTPAGTVCCGPSNHCAPGQQCCPGSSGGFGCCWSDAQCCEMDGIIKCCQQ